MSQTKTILVVDDEPRYVRLVEVNLTTEGYAVETAGNGQQAVESVASKQPDLVLLDIVMPPIGDMRDGVQVLRRLISKYPDAKVIMCSSLGHQGLVKEAIAAGAKDYIVKPFRAEKVVELASKYCPR